MTVLRPVFLLLEREDWNLKAFASSEGTYPRLRILRTMLAVSFSSSVSLKSIGTYWNFSAYLGLLTIS